MATIVHREHRGTLHPVHAILLAGTIPLFLGALLSDLAYTSSYQVQWTNFSSWLIGGGLAFAGLALLWAIVGLFRRHRRGRRWLVYTLLLSGTWLFGFVNALVHARDAWASMPAGLILSVIVAVLAGAATWTGLSSDIHDGGMK